MSLRSKTTVKDLLERLKEKRAKTARLASSYVEADNEARALRAEVTRLQAALEAGEKELAAVRAEATKVAQAVSPKEPQRERLPDTRTAVTRKFSVLRGEEPALDAYLTVGLYADGRPGELFLKCDRQGSLTSGALDAVAMSVSLGLQYGVPLSAYTDKFAAMRFEPAGFTGDADERYKTCSSVLDLIGRWLRDRFPG